MTCSTDLHCLHQTTAYKACKKFYQVQWAIWLLENANEQRFRKSAKYVKQMFLLRLSLMHTIMLLSFPDMNIRTEMVREISTLSYAQKW